MVELYALAKFFVGEEIEVRVVEKFNGDVLLVSQFGLLVYARALQELLDVEMLVLREFA